MPTDLPNRITQLIHNADSISAPALKSELLDLARHCQVVPRNQFLVSTVCESLEEAAAAVFGPLALLLVMTEPGRRQVYFAVLSRLETNGAFEAPGLDEAARADLLSRLVLSRNEDLVAYAYGSCPKGFLRLISRFGDRARRPEIYKGLFDLLDAHPHLAQPLLAACKTGPLTDELVELAQVLPPTPLGVRAAMRFERTVEYHRLMRPYEAITKSAQLSEAHLQRIADGETPGHLLEGLYLDLTFPAPILTSPNLTHIPDGQALVRTAKEFSNCLAGYVAEALNGERQFYIWRQPKAPTVVFAIDSEAPFGWYLSEAKLAKNERLPVKLQQDLRQMLTSRGIRSEVSVETMMHPYRDVPPTFMMDDFLELEEAA